MILHKEPIYRCDICGKDSAWVKGQWIAHVYAFKHFDHEFHLCSKSCDDVLSGLSKNKREEMAMNIWGESQYTS